MCKITIGGNSVENRFDKVAPTDSKFFNPVIIANLVDETIKAVYTLSEKRPDFTLEATVSLLYPQIKIGFNDARKNGITFKMNNLYHNDSYGFKPVNDWLSVLKTITSDEFLNLVDSCLDEFYAESPVKHTAITPIEQTIELALGN